MCDLLRKLRSEKKTFGSNTFPIGHHERRRRSIVAGINFNSVEDLRIHSKIVAWLGVLGIEGADPVLVRPPAATDLQLLRISRQSASLNIQGRLLKDSYPDIIQNIGVLENTIPCCVIW